MAEVEPFLIKQGDTAPSYAVVLTSGDKYVALGDDEGNPIADKVRFLMRGEDVEDPSAPAVTGEMTFSLEKIPDPKNPTGPEIEVWVCVYDWQPGDTEQEPGIYNTEHEVTWKSGKVETFPAQQEDPYLRVLILEDLG
jgi:hypothetical protein